MNHKWILKVLGVAAAAIVITARPALAHCDGLDGPVVQAAHAALATGDVRLALILGQSGGRGRDPARL